MRCTTAAASAGITRDMSQIWVSGSFVSALFAPSAIPSSWQTSSFPYLTLSLCFHLHRLLFFFTQATPTIHSFPYNAGSGETPTLHYSPTRLAFHFDREDSMEEFFSCYLR
ncbi:hypothetical protein FOZG_14959 [Fusarium oxysporum Fo47]|uniref:Uncharacterized protein n=1 Tax=Fusarium oxysporum Fo47 TaxID=660027 RepID=W9JJ03_FUSOX|nr:hypothetical protein FOZG_14959 [Fusarium oxysporum Fo47]